MCTMYTTMNNYGISVHTLPQKGRLYKRRNYGNYNICKMANIQNKCTEKYNSVCFHCEAVFGNYTHVTTIFFIYIFITCLIKINKFRNVMIME